MSKKKPKLEVAPTASRLPEQVLRVGSRVDFDFSVVEFNDDGSPLVIVEVLGPRDEALPSYVTAIVLPENDPSAQGQIYFSFEQQSTVGPESGLATVTQSDGAVLDVAKVEKVAERVSKMQMKTPLPPVTVIEVLNVRLTPDERVSAAIQGSNLLGELENAEAKFKAEKAERTSEIKLLKEKIRRAKEAHNTGLEYRSVSCEQQFDVEAGMTWFVFRGDAYGHRPMNDREEKETRSKGLFGDAPSLPNRIDTSKLASPKDLGGDTLSAKVKEKKAKDAKAAKGSVDHNGQAKDHDLREVMNEEKSRNGGKVDHVSS